MGPVVPATTTHWTPLDEHLLYTCGIVHDLHHERLHLRRPVPTMAPLDPDEIPLVVGPATQYRFRSLGDGSYVHTSVIAFGSPAFVAGSLFGSAFGNAHRRSRAQAAAQPRWVHDGTGELTITDERLILAHPHAPLDVEFAGMTGIELAAPDLFAFSFHDAYGSGHMTLQLQTLWASLLFVLAAATAFPAHPRLLAGDWLPPGFEARCHTTGRPCPPVR